MTMSQRFASWSYRTTVSPLLRASHVPVNPAKTVLLGTAPHSTAPCLSHTAMRVLTEAIT